MTTSSAGAAGPRLRSDAAENRRRILAAAQEVFAEAGLDAPVAAVARRAGVGTATVYRRFPTRDALIVAAFEDQVAACVEAVTTAAHDPDPWRGFCGVVQALCAMGASDRGFAAAFLAVFASRVDVGEQRSRAEQDLAALAEQRVERFVRAATGDPAWVAPESADVVPADVPEDRAAQRMRERLADADGPPGPAGPGGRGSPGGPGGHQGRGVGSVVRGVRFAERMAGTVVVRGRLARTVVDLEVHADDVAELVRDPLHALSVTGTVDVAGVASRAAATGTLSLFPDACAEAMRYALDLLDDSGAPLRLVGLKHQRPHDPLGLWSALTTLRLVLDAPDAGPTSDDTAGADEVTGVVRVSPVGALRLAASIRGTTDDPRGRASAVVSFLALFARGAVRGLLGWRRR